MILTEQGQRLFGHVREAFGRLRRGIEEVHRSPRRQRLVVSLPPALAARWVIPRLKKFRSLHPLIDTVLHASLELADFATEEIDVAIRYGLGRWRGLETHLLLREFAFPVCSPDFQGGKLPRTIEQVVESTLLHDPRQPWDEWFRANGSQSPPVLDEPVFSESNLVLEAAVNGQGVALADQALVERELASGALVRILPGRQTRAAYYIVHRRGQRLKRVVDFRTWLLEEARIDNRRFCSPIELT